MTQWIPESDIQAAGTQTAGNQQQLTGTRLAWDRRIHQLIIRLLEWLQAVLLPPPCEESWQSSFRCNGGTCPPGDQGQHPEVAQSDGLAPDLSSARQANDDQRESGLSSDIRPVFVRPAQSDTDLMEEQQRRCTSRFRAERGASPQRDVTREKIAPQKKRGSYFSRLQLARFPVDTISTLFPAQRARGQRQRTVTAEFL